jgi:hypothetical protein
MPSRKKAAPFLRALIEIGFIIFLFYSNLLMGEFTRSKGGPESKSLWLALQDVVTLDNFIIAVVSALIGYLIFEALRKKI